MVGKNKFGQPTDLNLALDVALLHALRGNERGLLVLGGLGGCSGRGVNGHKPPDRGRSGVRRDGAVGVGCWGGLLQVNRREARCAHSGGSKTKFRSEMNDTSITT